jgi:hypothetical protein
MTINIAVVTAEALVLGCDSIASTTQYLLDPFQKGVEPGEDGKASVTFDLEDVKPFVTNAWGGVTKMFELHASPMPVAAVTAGLAKLNGRTIASLANEFYLRKVVKDAPPTTVAAVAEQFLAFMRSEYDKHYEESALPPELRDGPLFLVGGYASGDHFPCLYRVNVQDNAVKVGYHDGDAGVAWEGQSDSVERLLRGYDTQLRFVIEHAVKEAISALRNSMADSMVKILQDTLDQLGATLPEGIDTALPEAPPIQLPWDRFRVPVYYANLPLQDAVDLAAFFVNLQSGKSKFSAGVATVGGRTHIGIITKKKGFVMLDEPELKHTNVGFV